MASSHHHHQHTHQQTHHTHQFNSCNCTSCCTPCCNSNSCNSLPPPPPPPPANPADQLLQALATSLLLQSQPQPQPYPQFQTPIPSSIPPIPPPVPFFYSPEHLAPNQYQYTFPHKTHQPPSHKSNEPLASLLDRVAALESSLFSNPNAKAIPVPSQKPSFCTNHETYPKTYSSNKPRASLKDLAARTIQVHFRQYLVRRSQILRDLKRLAVMKCHVGALRSAVSHRTDIDPKKVSDQAADMLLQLDFIKSADPMIYEGKRAIEKELVRIIEFVDKIFLREQEIILKETNGKEGEDEEEEEEEEGSTEEEKRLKKKVSFEESGQRSKYHNSEHELFKEVFEGHNGESFQIPKGIFELGDELEFDKMERYSGRKVGKRGGGSSAPVAAQNEARYDERR
ncbi:BAG family molecular chaperone regulator 8 [Carex littledalei]|uniref:BAG family molecular chaperone regulator 8 n=1 Tax=Carex littledalei TaxID=544730 RepID=A0A833V4U9_9POAL|nr:BAG family molecular chaperone regulator 8 [Carex littledalei]